MHIVENVVDIWPPTVVFAIYWVCLSFHLLNFNQIKQMKLAFLACMNKS